MNAILTKSSGLKELVASLTLVVKQMPALLADAVINVDGTKMTTAEIVAELESHITEIQELQNEHLRLRALVAAHEARRTRSRALALAVKYFIASTMGTASAAYAELGFAPAARRVTTAVDQVVANAKRAATRAARHTLGKRQRAAIHAAAPVAPTAPAAPTASEPAEPTAAPVIATPNARVA